MREHKEGVRNLMNRRASIKVKPSRLHRARDVKKDGEKERKEAPPPPPLPLGETAAAATNWLTSIATVVVAFYHV